MRGQLKGNSDARSRADCHTCILRSFERHRNLLGKDRTGAADNALCGMFASESYR